MARLVVVHMYLPPMELLMLQNANITTYQSVYSVYTVLTQRTQRKLKMALGKQYLQYFVMPFKIPNTF